MEKTTLLIVFALVLSVCTIHLPWINAVSTGIIYRRHDLWFWSFMERSVYSEREGFLRSYTDIEYKLFDEFWDFHGIYTSLIGHTFRMILTGIVPYFGGYYVIFLFQLLTVLFQSICIVIDKSPPLQESSPILLIIFHVATFIVSIGAPIVGINQYVRWSGQYVQFSSGFYLAVFSSVLTLIYALNFLVKIFRE